MKDIQSVKLGDVVHANAILQKANTIGKRRYKDAIISSLENVCIEELAVIP